MTPSTDEVDRLYATVREDLVAYFKGGGALGVVKAPPGSGKTFTLIEVLSTLVSEGHKIAIAAQTNSQADDICARITSLHPEVRSVRFASKGSQPPVGFPAAVSWVTDRSGLGSAPGVVPFDQRGS